MTVGSEFEGDKQTPGGWSEARSKGVKKRSKGLDPRPPGKSNPDWRPCIENIIKLRDKIFIRAAIAVPYPLRIMMMVLRPNAGSLAFTSPRDEVSEVVSRCLRH